MMLQRFSGQEGRLVTTELILPSKPLPALLRRARLTGPSLKDGMAQPLAALRYQDDAASWQGRILGIVQGFLGLE